MKGRQIFTLCELKEVANAKRAVIVPGTVWHKPKPAAVMMNLIGANLLTLFGYGMYIYEKPKKKEN